MRKAGPALVGVFRVGKLLTAVSEGHPELTGELTRRDRRRCNLQDDQLRKERMSCGEDEKAEGENRVSVKISLFSGESYTESARGTSGSVVVARAGASATAVQRRSRGAIDVVL